MPTTRRAAAAARLAAQLAAAKQAWLADVEAGRSDAAEAAWLTRVLPLKKRLREAQRAARELAHIRRRDRLGALRGGGLPRGSVPTEPPWSAALREVREERVRRSAAAAAVGAALGEKGSVGAVATAAAAAAAAATAEAAALAAVTQRRAPTAAQRQHPANGGGGGGSRRDSDSDSNSDLRMGRLGAEGELSAVLAGEEGHAWASAWHDTTTAPTPAVATPAPTPAPTPAAPRCAPLRPLENGSSAVWVPRRFLYGHGAAATAALARVPSCAAVTRGDGSGRAPAAAAMGGGGGSCPLHSVTRLRCDEGYDLIGPAERVCKAGSATAGRWGGLSTFCQVQPSPAPTPAPPTPPPPTPACPPRPPCDAPHSLGNAGCHYVKAPERLDRNGCNPAPCGVLSCTAAPPLRQPASPSSSLKAAAAAAAAHAAAAAAAAEETNAALSTSTEGTMGSLRAKLRKLHAWLAVQQAQLRSGKAQHTPLAADQRNCPPISCAPLKGCHFVVVAQASWRVDAHGCPVEPCGTLQCG